MTRILEQELPAFSPHHAPDSFDNGNGLSMHVLEAGYETSFFGKRGNTDEASQACFDHIHYLQPVDLDAIIEKYPEDEAMVRRSPGQGVLREGTPGKNLADRALEWLQRAVDNRDPQVVEFAALGDFDDLRGDPRLDAIRAQLGL